MKIYDYNGKKNICGDRLREARVVRRLRQEDLAAQIQLKGINMERDSISRIEIGTRFVSDFELKIFAEVLGVVEARTLYAFEFRLDDRRTLFAGDRATAL